MSTDAAYNAEFFTSRCCHAFNTYSGTSIICTGCGNTIGEVPKGTHLAISVRFNEHNTDNVSGDILASYRVKAKRFSEDPTYELCSQKCPKCGALSRYARDPQGNMIFICSNTKCRYVFDQNEVAAAEPPKEDK